MEILSKTKFIDDAAERRRKEGELSAQRRKEALSNAKQLHNDLVRRCKAMIKKMTLPVVFRNSDIRWQPTYIEQGISADSSIQDKAIKLTYGIQSIVPGYDKTFMVKVSTFNRFSSPEYKYSKIQLSDVPIPGMPKDVPIAQRLKSSVLIHVDEIPTPILLQICLKLAELRRLNRLNKMNI